MIARVKEAAVLKGLLNSTTPELVAITGRRRVGKTYLVRTVFAGIIDFEITGIKDASLGEQLQNFRMSLRLSGGGDENPLPANWLEAFDQLIRFLLEKRTNRKQVIFIDELPWLSGRKREFLKAFSFFWNSWASKQPIVVVVCGSAASWINRHLLNDTGGLHNRITRHLLLQPFDLRETVLFLNHNKVYLDHYQTMLLYMVMGGNPYYLNFVQPNQSAAQTIEQIFLQPGAPLRNEMNNLYASLFEHAERHVGIIEALAKSWKGLTHTEIIQHTSLSSGGLLTKTMSELELCGFISVTIPLGKRRKEALYRLTDEFSLFYFHFLANQIAADKQQWQTIHEMPAFAAWCGFAFENICFKQMGDVKQALGISGIRSFNHSFYRKGTTTDEGVQIDMVIDRADHCINLVETKFYAEPWKLSKTQAKAMLQKKAVFKAATKTSKHVYITMISPYEMLPNEHSIGLIDAAFTQEIFF